MRQVDVQSIFSRLSDDALWKGKRGWASKQRRSSCPFRGASHSSLLSQQGLTPSVSHRQLPSLSDVLLCVVGGVVVVARSSPVMPLALFVCFLSRHEAGDARHCAFSSKYPEGSSEAAAIRGAVMAGVLLQFCLSF